MIGDWTQNGCEEVAQRLGDFREGTLEQPGRGLVASHLRGCTECTTLLEALAEVSQLLHVEPPEPGPGFEERIAAETVARRASAPAPLPHLESLTRAARLAPRLLPLPLAAVLAVALGAALVLGLPEERLPEPARRLLARGATARELLREQQERLIEDVGALRLVVGGAFSSRVERIQEQLEDYRRLVGAPAPRKAPVPNSPPATRSFENFAAPAPVAVGTGQVVPCPRPTRA